MENENITGLQPSKGPSFQNIPIDTEQGARVRGGFTARRPLLVCDYSQIERQVLAHLLMHLGKT